MRHSLLRESRAHVLEHQPEAGIQRFKQFHLVTRKHSGIGMRQKPTGDSHVAGTRDIFAVVW